MGNKFYQKETNDYVERQYSANLTQLFMLIKKIYVYISYEVRNVAFCALQRFKRSLKIFALQSEGNN